MSEENPWLTMWVRPRATIRRIVGENPKRALFGLAFIYGFSSLLNVFQSFPIAWRIGLVPMFFFSVILAPLYGYLFFAIWSWIVVWVGKILKGKATFQEARAAFAWSCVPLLGNIPLWLLLIALYGKLLFYGGENHLMLSGVAAAVLFLILIGKLLFAIWSIVLYLQALAEVQQFSVLRSIGNVILAWILTGALMAIIWVVFFYLSGAGNEYHIASSELDWQNMRWIAHYFRGGSYDVSN